MEFKVIELKDAKIDIIDGDRGKNYPKKTEMSNQGHTLFLNNKNIINDYLDVTTGEFITEYKSNELRKGKLIRDDIVMSTRGSVGNIGYYSEDIALNNIRINSGMVILRNKNVKIDTKYLYILLKSSYMKKQYLELISGSVQNQLPIRDLQHIKLRIPQLIYQKKIVQIINNLEQKIFFNRKIISNLEKLSQTLFKRWFVDFEFPNEEGKPYKSSGGEMVESEMGEIPSQFSLGVLSDIYDNFDSKRKPLSKMNRMDREKIYPYYGAASLMDYVDDYLFRGRYLLLGEDGTVQTQEGKPILQFIEGKFWVNNHAHVMQGKNYFSTEYLYVLLKNTTVSNIITGAVQPKISQKNLNNIKIFLPNQDILMEFQFIISSVFDKIFLLKNENQNLQELRDTLLPKLLSGEIEIPEELEV